MGVEFCVGGERQRADGGEGTGHHVLREQRRHEVAQFGRGRCRAGPRHKPRGEFFPVKQHRRALHAGMPGQRGFDFARLDAKAAQFDLPVGGVAGERVGGEVFRRERRIIEVAPREVRRANMTIFPGSPTPARCPARFTNSSCTAAMPRPTGRRSGPDEFLEPDGSPSPAVFPWPRKI